MNATEEGRPILIVEDERIVALDLQQILGEFGFRLAEVATSADEALSTAARRRPDLVLMDIRINGDRDGIEAAEALKSRYDVPVIYLTAHADDATLQRAKATAPHGYLLKPIKAAELRSAVEVSLVRHDLEVRQREREQWFSATLESIVDAVVAVDLEGRVAFMNPAAAALTGVPVEAAIGQPVESIVEVREPLAELSVLRALREQRPVEPETAELVNRATREGRAVVDSAAPVVDPRSKRSLGAVMVFRDVTERLRFRAQLEQADRLASLGTLAAGVAHEVNNPLTVVVANAEFVREELGRTDEARGESVDTAAWRDALEDVQHAASRIGQIVADLKSFARPPAREGGTVDVVATAEWALRTTAQEFKSRARVVRQFAAVPHVAADEVRLGQVMINLLTNAAQALHAGQFDRNTITVTTAVDEERRVVFTVHDTGPGIPEAVKPHIFEPFYTTKRASGGTGLGLAICRDIVHGLGGTIEAVSSASAGTTMRVVLPAAVTRQASPAGTEAVVLPRKARLLVIDDESMLLEVIARILSGHLVETTTDARLALEELARDDAYDAVLVDVTMPAMSGVAFFQQLREHHPALARRVVFMSGGVFEPEFEAFLDTVPNPRIGKPFRAQDLLAVLARVTGAAGQPGVAT